MSKKMWNKIFKTKSSKSSKTLIAANKINKRCSIYEEYQQLNALMNCDKQQVPETQQHEQQQEKPKVNNSNLKEIPTKPTTTETLVCKSITTPPSIDETPLPACVAATAAATAAKQQSTFSKVVNTLTLKRNLQNPPKTIKDDTGNGNAKTSKTKSNKSESKTSNATNTPTFKLKERLSTTTSTSSSSMQILIVINKIACNDDTAADVVDVAANMVDHAQLSVTTTTMPLCNDDTNQNVLHVEKYNSNIIPPADEPEPNVSSQLTPCPICSRTFNPATLRKHVGICEKMAAKKRNIFDSSRQRREGTELAAYPLPKNYGLPATGGKHERGHSPKPQEVGSPILTRKKPADDFARATMRTSMRKRSNTITSPLTNSTTTNIATAGGSNFQRDRMRSSERSFAKRIQPLPSEQCPHCERCFGVKAYDRHVEWCREKALQASIKQNMKTEQNVAKERLEARTKYRAPCLKTKRSINRNKYSGFPGDENEMTESTKLANSNNNNIMSLSMTSSMTSERTKVITKPGHGLEASSSMKKRNSIELTRSQIGEGVNFDNCKEFRLTGEHATTCGKNKSKDVTNVLVESTEQELTLPSLMVVQRNLNKTYDDAIQDHPNEPQVNDSNDLSTALTLSSINAIPKLGTSKSTTALTKRKLKTKEKLLINLKTPMVNVQAVKANAADDDALRTLMASMSLPQIHQRQAIFEMSTTEAATTASKRATVAATTTLTAPTTAMHTKLETNPIKSPAICRPKRKKFVRQPNTSHATPLKAISLLKESIELFGMPARVLDDKEIKVIKAPPTPPLQPLTRNRSFILSGLPDKYDPFLSAKRQLEDLCSPTSANDPLEALKSPKTPNLSQQSQSQTPSTPSTPSILPTKMTTSLTLSTSTPLTPNNSQHRAAAPNFSTAPKPTSYFRRTSSLRGPRRSPLLPSRPLFAQKHRPTIQRGLSDEGPISTNFLKPEEYDEMPVRSVCVNDFAITNSPRVIRRDTSSSNRKNSLKLNINPSTATVNPNSSDERLASTASKYLSKTDSLAVFLKYENDLEKFNPTNIVAAPLAATKPIEPTLPVPNSLPAQNLNSPVITKELKDKSNTLSKQNSAKNIKTLDTPESPKINDEQQHQQQQKSTAPLLIPLVNQSTTPVSNQINNENISHNTKFAQLRLEPISKPSTPLSKPSTPQTRPNLTSYSAKSVLPLVATKLPAVNQPINLNAIFGDSSAKPQVNTNLSFSKERKNSSSSEYIDPKLINKCDNLTVNLINVHTLKHSDSDSSAHHHDSSESSPSSSVESSIPNCGPISQLTKLMPLSKIDNPVQAVHKQAPTQTNNNHSAVNQTNNNHSAVIQPSSTQTTPNPSQRNSTEGRNLLKRKMRLGRNQFLYDASPEADSSCSADDEANRSSVEYDEQQFNPMLFSTAQTHQHQTPPTRPLQTPQNSSRLHTPPTIPPLPIFDDFDFEEFLSSFENDEEQFPLFKDCREFLMNRTSNKQRSTLTPNSNFTNTNNSQSQPQQQQQQSPHQYQSPKPTSPFPHHSHHFQFPNLTPKNSQLLTPSTLRSNSNLSMRKESSSHPSQMQYNELKCPSSHDQEDLNKKREIFISIETEQNDLGRSPISPNSIRNMVGNPSAVVEVEVDAKDNKFTKLSDDEPLAPLATTTSQLNMSAPFMNAHNLPNVQLNNAKNLIQKMQDDFRQMSEEVSGNIRQAVENNQGQQTNANAKLLYGDSATAVRPATTPSANTCADSDDMSSLDGYPISQSSRRGVGSKLSADSAYGSLSRQRSSELSTHRNLSRTRPSTSNSATNTSMQSAMMDASTQHQQLPLEQQQQQHYKYSTMKSRGRQLSGSSTSSSSDNSLPPIVSHNNLSNSSYQQQLSQLYNPNNNNNNGRYESNLHHHHSNNNNNCESPLSSPTALTTPAPTMSSSINALGASNNSSSNALSHSSSTSNTAMSASMKLSKFCHECGGKFLIDQAKFCMDCGVRRIVL